tara:strand:+ start:752 stop:1003 length:252 start_codon:yes stop_codon:yes gene_type:complete
MFNTDTLLAYLSSSEGINKIILGIIMVGAMNAIFIIYSVRSTYGKATKEREKLKFNKLILINYLLRRNSIYGILKIMDESIKR